MSYYQRKISKALKVRIKLLIKNLYIQVMKLRGITFSSFFLFKVKKISFNKY